MVNMKSLVWTLVTFCLQKGVFSQSCWKDTVCSGPTSAAFPGEWDANIFAPSSRTISPKSILSYTGATISSYPDTAILASNGSQLVFDFGIEVGGLVTLEYSSTGAGAVS